MLRLLHLDKKKKLKTSIISNFSLKSRRGSITIDQTGPGALSNLMMCNSYSNKQCQWSRYVLVIRNQYFSVFLFFFVFSQIFELMLHSLPVLGYLITFDLACMSLSDLNFICCLVHCMFYSLVLIV